MRFEITVSDDAFLSSHVRTGNGDEYAVRVARAMKMTKSVAAPVEKVDDLLGRYAKKPRFELLESGGDLPNDPPNNSSNAVEGCLPSTQAADTPGVLPGSPVGASHSLARTTSVPSLAGQGVSSPSMAARGEVGDSPSSTVSFEVDGATLSCEFGAITLSSGRVLTMGNLDQLVRDGVTPLTDYALDQIVKVVSATI